MMTDAQFQFNFKFNLHKSCIPIGLKDDDYQSLSTAYGVSLEDMMAEVEANQAFLRAEADLLLQKYPDFPQKMAGKKIAFLGDSITSDRRSYFNIIRTALKGSDVQLLDDAISGYKVVDIITNFVPGVTDFAPDIVHIMIGSNDLKRTSDARRLPVFSVDEYAKDLDYLVDSMLNRGAKLILTTIPPFDDAKTHAKFFEVNACFMEEDRMAFNAVVREQAKKVGCLLNDMDPLYEKHSIADLTLEDGLHLNGIGQRMLTCGVVEKLLQL